MSYSFHPTVAATLLTVCAIGLCIKLGLWQYHKAQWKQALQATLEQYSHAEPVDLPPAIADTQAWKYKRVKVTGTYDARHQILLDNQFNNESVGYNVITPLHINNSDRYILVNRGWIPAPPDHRQTPQVSVPEGGQTVIGQLWLPPARYYSLGKASDSGHDEVGKPWQILWQNLDMKRYSTSVPYPVYPMAIRLDPENAGGFARNWPQPGERVEMNISYAYQWFGFALAAFGIWIYTSLKPRKRMHN